jgi:hypothetical protein
MKMSMSNELLSTISRTRALLIRFERFISEHDEGAASIQAKPIIDSIPFKIAQADLQGMNYAHVMDLTEGAHFVVPSLIERWRGKRPSKLCGEALSVFDYCLREGLQPVTESYTSDCFGKHLTSRIVITWSSESLDSKLQRCSPSEGSFVQVLSMRKEASCQPTQVVASSRLSGAYAKLPKIIETIQLAANRGESRVHVHSEYSFGGPFQPTPNCVSDICEFLRLLELQVELVVGDGILRGAQCAAFKIYVSGW